LYKRFVDNESKFRSKINIYSRAHLLIMSRLGPTSTAFHPKLFFEGHSVKPSWCLLVSTTYLQMVMKIN